MREERPPRPGSFFFEVRPGLRLRIGCTGQAPSGYPTDSLAKGLTLECNGIDLSEEGVGFGVPVIKLGRVAVFPGAARETFRDPARQLFCVEYVMDLRELLAMPGLSLMRNRPANFLKEIAGELHRAYPWARAALDAVSRRARRSIGIRTIFRRGRRVGVVRVEYRFDPARRELRMAVDSSGIQAANPAEVILMNEQGANYFDLYADSDGALLSGREICAWAPVAAARARFIDAAHDVGFAARKAPGARLYRGRELAPGRLAWAGFAYRVLPGRELFHCSVVVGGAG
jgi:hypothetical protein